MTDRDKKGDTGAKRTPDTTSSRPDPRIAALVRMLARRAAERDFEELLRRHDKARRTPGGKDQPT